MSLWHNPTCLQSFLDFWQKKPQPHLILCLNQAKNRPFLQEALFPFIREWYLEIKIWFHYKLIATGISLLLGQGSEQHYRREGPASWVSYPYSHNCVWGLMPCNHCLEILCQFTSVFVFGKWSPVIMEHTPGAWSLGSCMAPQDRFSGAVPPTCWCSGSCPASRSPTLPSNHCCPLSLVKTHVWA